MISEKRIENEFDLIIKEQGFDLKIVLKKIMAILDIQIEFIGKKKVEL